MFYIVRQSDRDIHSDNMMCMDGHEWILMPSFPGDTLLVKYETSNDNFAEGNATEPEAEKAEWLQTLEYSARNPERDDKEWQDDSCRVTLPRPCFWWYFSRLFRKAHERQVLLTEQKSKANGPVYGKSAQGITSSSGKSSSNKSLGVAVRLA
jgi:hypothetical protein